MDSFYRLIKKAKHSKFFLWIFNAAALRVVPFNYPHRIRVVKVEDDGLSMYAPFRRSNLNHIKGMHACLLATLCEYVSGLTLLLHLSPKEYRIILTSINITYHYQAKSNVFAKFRLDKKEVEETILEPLKKFEAVFREYTVEVYDANNKHICTGIINWQIKPWNKVKTK